MRKLLFVIGLGLSLPLAAQGSLAPADYANRQLEDAGQEARAAALMEELRCLVCQGQSIADSDADMAGDMRHLVRERIQRGESPAEIRDYLIERYGEWVSYRPAPERPIFWPLYLAPVLLLLIAGWMVRRRFRRPRP
ncbi:cytochrome c-type biogenesis protein [Sphingomicrobium lutaoense]|uniref:Cytochrome c-type biogenesis protein n=1 Tax=Sphingomicrobium lutaoense TaxID=515949 RepID=A0A839YYM6_9SPHN|nr:cytochrome c-type biogenesis protein [Sphingomicrobium lutaoense]MBB3763580.1 cytochrome c-type biogenesis protein CcmH [Sphingomicrobium lutaoense]